MRLTLRNHKQNQLLIILLSTLLITGCGGSGASLEEIASAPEAILVSTAGTEVINLQARAEDSQFSIEDTGANLAISIDYQDLITAKHNQIFLNTDNDTATGFGFNGVAWGAIGADFMIQNQYLYRSNSNTAVWDWEPVSQITSYERTDNQIELSINKNLIGSPCGTIHVGTMGRNENWGVEVMYPVAMELMSVSIEACLKDVISPVVKLIGDAEITITQGETFNDPGASAIDDVDGDISELLHTTGEVNTAIPGVYTLVYISTDSSGNVAISPVREVTVVESEEPLPPVTLNGDWESLVNQQFIYSYSVGGLVAYQDQTNKDIYLRLDQAFGDEAAHIQIYLDIDNDPTTGYQVWDNWRSIAVTGAEYIIENGQMARYIGNGIGWSWSDEVTSIPYSYQHFPESDVSGIKIRAIIPSSVLSQDKVSISMMHITPDWSRYSVLVEASDYTLLESDN